MGHFDDNKVKKRITIPNNYVTKGNIKTIEFIAGKCRIKSVIKEINQFEEETTFFVNNKPIKIFSSFDSSTATRQYGGMNFANGTAYIFTHNKQQYVMVAAYPETAQGSFINVSIYFFLPLDAGNITGITFDGGFDMVNSEPDSTTTKQDE